MLRSSSLAGKHPTVYEYSAVCRNLKSKSAWMIFDRHANLKYKYGSRNFWRGGYYVDTGGRMQRKQPLSAAACNCDAMTNHPFQGSGLTPLVY